MGDDENTELLPPAIRAPGELHVTALTKPLTFERQLVTVDAGVTIAELLRLVGIPEWAHTRVTIDGVLVYPEFYRVVRPKRGTHVGVRVVPQGGGSFNQRNVKSAMTMALGLNLIVVGAFLLSTPFGIPLIGGGVGLLLSGREDLLIPPAPRPS